ncbi:cardiolipin synthase [Oceanobacillus sp. CF4.6]|uniref:cardiolipin synthase n=1 Tax=Oceanobacillus sp. CF4.6 TaxID=3373080 RepID=UPI003EE5DDD3
MIVAIEPCFFENNKISNWYMKNYDNGSYIQNEKGYLDFFKDEGFKCKKVQSFKKFIFYNELFFCCLLNAKLILNFYKKKDRRDVIDSEIINVIVLLVIISNLIFAAVVLFTEKREIGATWAWIMAIIFIPIVGLIFYLFLGRQLKHKNIYKTSTNKNNLHQSTVNEQIKLLQNSELYNNHLFKKYSKLLLMNLKSSNALISMDNEIVILNNGQEKFNALFKDIRAARKEINIQYYTIKQDSLGVKLLDELTKKAQEGVKVRLLYDAIGSRGMSPAFFDELILYGGEVEVFFPSFLKLINFHVNHRNHRKISIIDGNVAYIGGFNVGNEYLGLDKKYGYWRDSHCRIIGGAVNGIQERFILDWYQAKKGQKSNSEKFLFLTEEHNGNSPIQIITSGPNSETEYLKNMYIMLIMSAKRTVYIQTPYFIPDKSFMDACKITSLAGVDIRIMIPKRDYNTFVYWANKAYTGELLTYGVRILLYEKGFLHAKTIVVDQEVASVGTTNIDIRSFNLNFEANAIVYDKKVAEQLHKVFIEDSQVSSELTMKRYIQRSVKDKCKESISRLFSPIL